MIRIMANRTDVRVAEMTGENRKREGGKVFTFEIRALVRGLLSKVGAW